MSQWTEVSENVWATEISTLQIGDPNKAGTVSIPNPATGPVRANQAGVPLSVLDWTPIRAGGELVQWEAKWNRYTYIIFND